MRERERERKRERERVLLIHIFLFLLLFFSYFFFALRTVYVFWIRYKIDVVSSNAYRSVVRMMTQVFGLEKRFYFENVVASFQARN